MNKVIILGAGISGLSLGWFLKKKYGTSINLEIHEKTSRPGGWIQTQYYHNTLFDQGPRSCRIQGNGLETLKLIEELGLKNQVLIADRKAKNRFIYSNNALQALPMGLASFLSFPWKKAIIKGFWNDLNTPKNCSEDETIYNFICRRFNQDLAELFADPLTSGIYAGDIRKLSVQSCFPDWYEREQNYGGILKSLWKKKSLPLSLTSDFIKCMKKHSIFTLKSGMESLVQTLAKKLELHIKYESEAVSLKADKHKSELIFANGKSVQADFIGSALPSFALGNLLKEHYAPLAEFPHSIPYASVAVVNFGYYQKKLKLAGFGYLIPSKENSLVLGVVWDSSVFPEQNGVFTTRLCVMLGGAHHPEVEIYSDKVIIEKALEALNFHLGILDFPEVVFVKKAISSIPQYQVGHNFKKTEFTKRIKDKLPSLSIIGTAFNGVSVNDCIAHAKILSESLLNRV